ncbi:MAG TPA: hypothetical protein VH591_14220 [Ktedonobacterales bacterium]
MRGQSAILTAPRSDDATRLSGRRLVVVRAGVFAIVALTLAIYALALPGLVPHMSIPCEDAVNSCIISPQQVVPLARLGITPGALAVAAAIISYLSILLVCAVAAVLLWRRSDDWMALLVALTLILMPAVFTPVMQGLPASLQWLGHAYGTAAFVSLYLLIGLFPNGRFVPRWVWAPVLLELVVENIPSPQPQPTGFLVVVVTMVSAFVILFSYACLIGGQIYRYRRVSTPVQRQQTKWAVAGLVLTLVVNQLFWQPAIWIQALQQPDSLYPLLAGPDSFLMIAILAVSFGFAMLRYRLYDIDIIIRRTLIYGSLTAILAGVYIAGVIGAQSIVNTIARTPSGKTSPVLIVITTLLIAALFQPLRHAIQRFIDRRFYRSKYDTRKTLEAFSATLRQEVDLSTLTGQLVSVVTETMQPEHISLWIRDRDAIR